MLSWGEADNAIDIGRKVSDLLKVMEHFVGKFCWRYRTGKDDHLKMLYNPKDMESCFLMKLPSCPTC